MQVSKKSVLFFGKKLMSTKHLSLDRTLFFHHNFGEAILKRHPAMRRQNCFQNRLFSLLLGHIPLDIWGSGCCPSGLVWFGGDRFLSFPCFLSVVCGGFLCENLWVLPFWLGVVWGRPFFVISLFRFCHFSRFLGGQSCDFLTSGKRFRQGTVGM